MSRVGGVEQDGSHGGAERRVARLVGEQRAGALAPGGRAWVDLPLPSPPSNAMKWPVTCALSGWVWLRCTSEYGRVTPETSSFTRSRSLGGRRAPARSDISGQHAGAP